MRRPFSLLALLPSGHAVLLYVVGMCVCTGGAMDAAVSDIKRCADLFLFSTTFYSQSLTPLKPQGNSAFPPRRTAQRCRLIHLPGNPSASHPQPTSHPATLSSRPEPHCPDSHQHTPCQRPSNNSAYQTASPARAYVHPHHPLPTKKKICYNTTTQTNYIQNPKKDKVNHK